MKNTAKLAPKKLTGTKPVRGRKTYGRSRLSNGHAGLLPDVDGRSSLYRRYRDICSQILVDMGGIDQCSESKKHLIRRFAAAAFSPSNLKRVWCVVMPSMLASSRSSLPH
jgi:hypothetical protein